MSVWSRHLYGNPYYYPSPPPPATPTRRRFSSNLVLMVIFVLQVYQFYTNDIVVSTLVGNHPTQQDDADDTAGKQQQEPPHNRMGMNHIDQNSLRRAFQYPDPLPSNHANENYHSNTENEKVHDDETLTDSKQKKQHKQLAWSKDASAIEMEPMTDYAPPPPTAAPKPFQPSKFDYSSPAIPISNVTLPFPVHQQPQLQQQQSSSPMVVLVMSARSNFEQRQKIRETWARGYDNVYFLIGGPNNITEQEDGNSNSQSDQNDHSPSVVSPESNNQNIVMPGSDENHNAALKTKIDMQQQQQQQQQQQLVQEQAQYQDLLDTIHPESYKALPYKLQFGIRWVMKHYPFQTNVDWIVKVDDDMSIRSLSDLYKTILQKFNPSIPIVMGRIMHTSKPQRTGKWAEDPKFQGEYYPPWPLGSAGYVMSASIAHYVASQERSSLYYYQGEDVSVGIWLKESNTLHFETPITWIHSPMDFISVPPDTSTILFYCSPTSMIVGHGLDPSQMEECFHLQQGKDPIPSKQQQNDDDDNDGSPMVDFPQEYAAHKDSTYGNLHNMAFSMSRLDFAQTYPWQVYGNSHRIAFNTIYDDDDDHQKDGSKRDAKKKDDTDDNVNHDRL